MALVGFRQQVSSLSNKITEIEKELRGGTPKRRRQAKVQPITDVAKPKRKMSAAGLEAIRKGQARRWRLAKKAKKAEVAA